MMRTSSKPTPGTLAIVLQFVLLTGVVCGVVAGFYKRQQPVMPTRISNNSLVRQQNVPLPPESDRISIKPVLTWRWGMRNVRSFEFGPTSGRIAAVLGDVPDQRECTHRLFAFEVKTGKFLWQMGVYNFLHWASDNERLYVFGGHPNAQLSAYEWTTGQRLWSLEMGECSQHDKVSAENGNVIAYDGKTAIGLGAATGKEQWRVPIEGEMLNIVNGRLYFHQNTDAQYAVPLDLATQQLGQAVMFTDFGDGSYSIFMQYDPQHHVFIAPGIVMSGDLKSLLVMTEGFQKLWGITGKWPYGGPAGVHISGDLLIYTDFRTNGIMSSSHVVARDIRSGGMRWQRITRRDELVIGIVDGVALVGCAGEQAFGNDTLIGVKVQDGQPLWSLHSADFVFRTRADLCDGGRRSRAQLCGNRLLIAEESRNQKPARIYAYLLRTKQSPVRTTVF